VCYRSLGGFGICVEDVSGSTVCVEGFVQRHVQVCDYAVGAEDFAEMCGSDILGQLLNDNLRRIVLATFAQAGRHCLTFELRGIGGVGLRSRPLEALRAR